MIQEKIPTGRDGRLFGRLWRPAKPDHHGTVVVVHGLGDHAGRYARFATRLCQSGWSVFAFDLPGHGESPGTAGKIESYDSVLVDIAAARQTIADRFGTTSQVLLGHSMGGNFAINYALRQSEMDGDSPPLAGLSLCAPMILPPTPMPRSYIMAAWLTGHLLPWLRFKRRVDPDLLTADEAEVRAIKDDPKMHSKISMYLATQLVAQGRWALDHARDVDIPTLVMHGEEDRLIDRNVSENLAIRIGPEATLVTWPQTRHALFHDHDRDAVTDRLIGWLTGLETPPGS